ncbi:MAG: hypothetical protein WD993_03505 [Thermoleophilaceae bacterium]
MAWTDERLDNLSQRMDAGFERVDRDIRDLRHEMRFEIGGLRGEIGDLRVTLVRVGGGIMVGVVGVIAAIAVGGA